MIAALLLVATLQTPDLSCRVRDAHGNVIRSRSRRQLFLKMTGFPHGRPGYRADHIVPLACGGCDTPANFEWLTVAEWSAKTKWERKPCSAWWDGTRIRQIHPQEAN